MKNILKNWIKKLIKEVLKDTDIVTTMGHGKIVCKEEQEVHFKTSYKKVSFEFVEKIQGYRYILQNVKIFINDREVFSKSGDRICVQKNESINIDELCQHVVDFAVKERRKSYDINNLK